MDTPILDKHIKDHSTISGDEVNILLDGDEFKALIDELGIKSKDLTRMEIKYTRGDKKYTFIRDNTEIIDRMIEDIFVDKNSF